MNTPVFFRRFRIPIVIGITLIIGLFLGKWFFGTGSSESASSMDAMEHEGHSAVWTCSMHPQIRMNEPGQCPICGMDLIPATTSGRKDGDMEGMEDMTAVHLSEHAMKLANVQTMVVGEGGSNGMLRLTGKVEADERRVFAQATHVAGRVEELLVNFTGEKVAKGQALAKLYAPELVTAQEELLQAHRIREAQPQLYASARVKLRNWKLSDAQIDAVISSGTASGLVTIQADVSGIVLEKRAELGDYLQRGEALYQIADLSQVWVLFDVYESDLGSVRKGDVVSFTIRSLPGESFEGTISFVDPIVDPNARVARARVEVQNAKDHLKPGMFVTGEIKTTSKGTDGNLVVPRSAILWTGQRSVVYVKDSTAEHGLFRMREVTLGAVMGNDQVIASGLRAGDEVVVNGTFTVDAAAQLSGAPSMMSPEGGPAPTGHQHGGSPKASESKGSATTPVKEHAEHRAKEGALATSVEPLSAAFMVYGNCSMCKDRIEKAANGVNGVMNAEWNVDTKMISVQFDPAMTTELKVASGVARAGHDTQFGKARDDIYQTLPACCQYDRPQLD